MYLYQTHNILTVNTGLQHWYSQTTTHEGQSRQEHIFQPTQYPTNTSKIYQSVTKNTGCLSIILALEAP